MKVRFRKAKLGSTNQQMLARIERIVNDYKEQGYRLTLRQLYYQLVSKNVIANKDTEYDKLGKLVKEGRMSGQIDWEAIEDRLRVPKRVSTWSSAKSVLESALYSFQLDRYIDQSTKWEVWVEKDALSQIVERAARPFQGRTQVNRGYASATAIYDTYRRVKRELEGGAERFVLFYLGDHDPSGLNMLEDIRNRVVEMLMGEPWQHYNEDTYDDLGYMYDCKMDYKIYHKYAHEYFVHGTVKDLEDYQFEDLVDDFGFSTVFPHAAAFELIHLGLTMEQIEAYNPPPNPAKLSDSRAKKYVLEHGYSSWEVDALPPQALTQIIQDALTEVIEQEKVDKWQEDEDKQKERIQHFVDEWDYELKDNTDPTAVPIRDADIGADNMLYVFRRDAKSYMVYADMAYDQYHWEVVEGTEISDKLYIQLIIQSERD